MQNPKAPLQGLWLGGNKCRTTRTDENEQCGDHNLQFACAKLVWCQQDCSAADPVNEECQHAPRLSCLYSCRWLKISQHQSSISHSYSRSVWLSFYLALSLFVSFSSPFSLSVLPLFSFCFSVCSVHPFLASSCFRFRFAALLLKVLFFSNVPWFVFFCVFSNHKVVA